VGDAVKGHRLSGRKRPRGRRDEWLLIVNLPREQLTDDQGELLLDARGRPRWRYPTTQRQFTGGAKAADTALRDWIEELEQHDGLDPSTMTVEQLLKRWLLATKHDMRPVSHQFYRGICERHLYQHLGDQLAADMQRADFAEYMSAAMDRGLSEKTVGHHRSTLRCAYNWGMDGGLLDRNPLARMKRGAGARKPQKRLTIWNSVTIAKAVVLARGSQAHAAAVLGGWAGLRAGEMCALRWEDVALADGLMLVCRTVEEDRDAHELVEFTPKGYNEEWVPLTSVAVEELRRLHHDFLEERLARPSWNPEGRVICRVSGAQMRPSSLSSIWAGFVARSGLPKLHLHGLRHSFGTLAYELEGAKVAQHLLRHTLMSTTTNTYVHQSKRAQGRATARMERVATDALAKAEAQVAAADSLPTRDSVVSLSGASG
jgi:integrase